MLSMLATTAPDLGSKLGAMAAAIQSGDGTGGPISDAGLPLDKPRGRRTGLHAYRDSIVGFRPK